MLRSITATLFCMLPARVSYSLCSRRGTNRQCTRGDLSRDQQALCYAQITAQAFTFLLAGYETTANALAFATYLLALNPDKEAAMIDEIDAFGRDAMPGYDDLVKVQWLIRF